MSKYVHHDMGIIPLIIISLISYGLIYIFNLQNKLLFDKIGYITFLLFGIILGIYFSYLKNKDGFVISEASDKNE